MAIRTIAFIQGHYTALQGHWNWDESTGFHFIPLSRPPLSAQHSTLLDVPYILVPFNSPCRNYPGGLEDNPAAESTDADAEDDTEPSSLDSSLCSIDFEPPSRLASIQEHCGLGIIGLSKKDGSGPFTGFGIVSIHSPWRNTDTSLLDTGCDIEEALSSWNVSDTMLQETLLTFNEDSMDQTLGSIPECDSWYSEPSAVGLELELAPTAEPTTCATATAHSSVFLPPQRPPATRASSAPHFARPTISSQLKSVPITKSNIAFPSRRHSSSCLVASDPLRSFKHQRRSISDPSPFGTIASARRASNRGAYIRSRTCSAGEAAIARCSFGLV
ncbi:hypothetical protein P691DRAFT_264735 [Macrolepiota fuliginosa MF-IS2]|uniref:Uncharacterized protein n=1 Tax=Macrolepiota fuliginosa MF-IS2 TaxID=1400762 RepID=A0A9P5XA22_9AGAR|nr:hypothetical protein P691DRAFT_264735 [Macrolepiota fuliginosa MF-IS2]